MGLKINNSGTPGTTIESKLTVGQKEFLDSAENGKNIFLTGNAGTGKSVALSTFIKNSKEQGKNVLTFAPTGNAAQLIGGTTIHHGLGITPKDIIDTDKMTVKGKTSKVLQAADIIVVDEISMVRMDQFDFLGKSIEKAEKKAKKKIQLVVVGDFCQLPPIIDYQRQENKVLNLLYGRDVGLAYAFLSDCWMYFNFENYCLTQVMRQDKPFFIEKLNDIRMGKTDDSVMSLLYGYFCNTDPAENAVYLAARQDTVKTVNERCLMKLPGSDYFFTPYRTSDASNGRMFETMPAPLRLRVGARVMFTKNEYSIKWSGSRKPAYYNGTMGTIVDIYQAPYNKEYARIIVKVDDTGEEVETGFVEFETYGYRYIDGKIEMFVSSSYRAVPLQLAYALTIHKAQGITLPAVNLDPYCFTSGQFYVALSRCSDPDKIHLTAQARPDYIKTDPVVIDFYNKLDTSHSRPAATGRDGRVTYPASDKGGAPVRYPTGAKVMKIPTEITQQIKEFLDMAYPKNGSGTVKYMRDALLEFFESENAKSQNSGKRSFPAGSKSMRIPQELSEPLDHFIHSIWSDKGTAASGIDKFQKTVKGLVCNKNSIKKGLK